MIPSLLSQHDTKMCVVYQWEAQSLHENDSAQEGNHAVGRLVR